MTKLIVKFQPGGPVNNTGTTGNNAQQGFQQGWGYGMLAQGIGGFANKFPTPNADLNGNNQMAAQVRDGVSNALLSSGNPYAMVAGAAVKVLDKTGGFSDVSEGLGAGNDIGNAIMSFALPGAGWFMPKTDKYKMSADMKVMSRGYAGSVKDAETAENNSGAKLWFGRSKANRMITDAQFRDQQISNIKQNADTDFQTARSMTQNKAISNQYALLGGYNQSYARAGKFGLKLERAQQLAIKFREPSEIKEQQEVYVMKDGGEFFANLRKEFIPTTEEQNNEFFASLIPEFQKGGRTPKKVKSDKSYYDKNTDTIYYTDDEASEHEGFHARPDEELLQLLAPYYSDLDDHRITELGGDLEFVKRFENDPGYFYSPEELGARITAAKFRTKGQEYTPEFFANLRNNENQYGDNMRDLLHMYDDKTLAKIFNIRERRDRIAKLMKDVIEPAAKSGNKTAMRLMDMDKNSYTFTDNDVENGYKGKVGDVGNVYIGHDPEQPYIVPGIQYVNDKLQFISDPWKDGPNEQWIQFPSNEDAAFFGENYHDFPELVPTLANWKKKFKEGGQMNVIPEGSLHARLHHMENADNLTKKGIPVVDNEGNQQAEIEHSEIIFTKEVTEKLEELYKKFKSDEYTNKEKEGFAIEAGKLLSKEIIENTDDRVGLINTNN